MNASIQKLDLIRWITEVIKKQDSQDDWWDNISVAEKNINRNRFV
jgi:hypothetical protein